MSIKEKLEIVLGHGTEFVAIKGICEQCYGILDSMYNTSVKQRSFNEVHQRFEMLYPLNETDMKNTKPTPTTESLLVQLPVLMRLVLSSPAGRQALVDAVKLSQELPAELLPLFDAILSNKPYESIPRAIHANAKLDDGCFERTLEEINQSILAIACDPNSVFRNTSQDALASYSLKAVEALASVKAPKFMRVLDAGMRLVSKEKRNTIRKPDWCNRVYHIHHVFYHRYVPRRAAVFGMVINAANLQLCLFQAQRWCMLRKAHVPKAFVNDFALDRTCLSYSGGQELMRDLASGDTILSDLPFTFLSRSSSESEIVHGREDICWYT